MDDDDDQYPKWRNKPKWKPTDCDMPIALLDCALTTRSLNPFDDD